MNFIDEKVAEALKILNCTTIDEGMQKLEAMENGKERTEANSIL